MLIGKSIHSLHVSTMGISGNRELWNAADNACDQRQDDNQKHMNVGLLII